MKTNTMRYILIFIALLAFVLVFVVAVEVSARYIAHADSVVVNAIVPVNACNECVRLCR